MLKTGSDFIDPAILARAAGSPVYTLDLWMDGEHECERQLGEAARDADILLVEGVMGLFDGHPSTADVAQRFELAVLLVVDAAAMAETFGAVVHGLVAYRPELRFVGALANRVAGTGHAEMLADSVRDRSAWCGAVFSDDRTTLPERHLGLVMPEEVSDLDARIERAADALLGFDLDRLPVSDFAPVAAPTPAPALRGVRIAVARDAAFCFVYPANLDMLRTLGAELRFFSPCDDRHLPEADALGALRGHAFHHSTARGTASHSELATSPHGGHPEPVYGRQRLVASYVHWYLPSNPEAAARLFAP